MPREVIKNEEAKKFVFKLIEGLSKLASTQNIDELSQEVKVEWNRNYLEVTGKVQGKEGTKLSSLLNLIKKNDEGWIQDCKKIYRQKQEEKPPDKRKTDRVSIDKYLTERVRNSLKYLKELDILKHEGQENIYISQNNGILKFQLKLKGENEDNIEYISKCFEIYSNNGEDLGDYLPKNPTAEILEKPSISQEESALENQSQISGEQSKSTKRRSPEEAKPSIPKLGNNRVWQALKSRARTNVARIRFIEVDDNSRGMTGGRPRQREQIYINQDYEMEILIQLDPNLDYYLLLLNRGQTLQGVETKYLVCPSPAFTHHLQPTNNRFILPQGESTFSVINFAQIGTEEYLGILVKEKQNLLPWMTDTDEDGLTTWDESNLYELWQEIDRQGDYFVFARSFEVVDN